jgi:hypothetical protein
MLSGQRFDIPVERLDAAVKSSAIMALGVHLLNRVSHLDAEIVTATQRSS